MAPDMQSELLAVHTGSEWFTDLTTTVTEFCSGHDDGLCHVFIPHATAGVALMELHAGSEPDVQAALEELFPRDDRWVHHHGSPGHGADHVLPVFVSPSLAIPVSSGRPLLGTWQSVVLIDPNRDNPERQIRLSFLAG